ncbi:saccharopine dehydrogenase family protein [Melghirimyces algeriensis]|uniref:Saccharopine dehydrogenase NADP binding domain-containing protein n=1 Tax=Melghirimyces algeriensis TaxID=910412 RepID=A0A521DK28_9BACL|nr:saccharopine dehydrogenase NADP-binding domain-containing protein [Melghirimyces algeriensis]SMO71932.1 Saccharopine dehydrogenase NADP binding domain-containing protein [Melghirimyces algeriensis]
MKDQILVVGGYGHVGRLICEQLGKRYPGKVIAAGRRLSQAEEFCKTTNGRVIPRELDTTKPLPSDLLDKVKLVVMCLDQRNLDFVQACFANRVDYIDISANASFLSRVETLEAEAIKNETTAVLSVGLAPGLTNLLAKYTTRYMDQTEAIDIYVLLGLGDQHGKAAIEWTIDHLDTSFYVYSNREKVKAETFDDGKTTDFGRDLGDRTGYRFNFSDQHSLPHTLKVPTVSTRLCLDSRTVTKIFALCKRAGIFHLLKYQSLRTLAVWLLSKIRWGREIYALKIDAWGEVGGKRVLAECALHGQKEASITAAIATRVSEELYTNKWLKGIYHIEELFDIDSLCSDIIPEVHITEIGKETF